MNVIQTYKNHGGKKMLSSFRIDSCRKCGSTLHAIRHCRDCEQPLVFECYNCHAFIDPPIHQHGISSQSFLQLDENVNPGYQGINISFKIKSDASEETLQELINLAKKASPVANTISRPTPINVTLVKQGDKN